MKRWILLVLLVASPVMAEDLPYVQWLSCHDGDTCDFNIMTLVPVPAVFGKSLGVRLLGIDTPEKNGKCAKEKALAIVARDFLISKMQGATIQLLQVSRDKYFRVEAVAMVDGVNLNELLIQQGYAVAYAGSGPRHNWCR